MGFIQNLQGITVTPSSALRNSKGLFREDCNKWPKGYAFGGWIYNATCKIGFSKQPTEINLSIVLETKEDDPKPDGFDLSEAVLSKSLGGHGATNFIQEENDGHFYTIEAHGVTFNRMYLYNYEFAIEGGSKILTCTFKDYSLILNKIYIGLIKRQGPGKPYTNAFGHGLPVGAGKSLVKTARADIEMEAFCPNCYLTGGGFGTKMGGYGANLNKFFSREKGRIFRDCELGSFVGIHGSHGGNLIDMNMQIPANVIDLACYRDPTCFPPHPARISGAKWEAPAPAEPRAYWNNLAFRVNALGQVNPAGFTMDGGYMLIGTEDFAEKLCGALPNISYSFSELLNSLKYRGIEFTNTQLGEYPDKNPKFRANYIGTLREVLEQWCGIMSLDFFFDNLNSSPGNVIRFIDLEQGSDINPIREMIDPSTTLGQEFGGEDPAAGVATSVIISYKESSSMENTYLQKCITANTRPYTKKDRTKEVKRYIPILPLHPLDFNYPSWDIVNYQTILGEDFKSAKLANVFPWTNVLRGARASNSSNTAVPDSHDCMKRLRDFTNRQFWDVDIALTLQRYDKTLRDLYVGQRVIDSCFSNNWSRVHYKRDSSGKITDKIQRIDPAGGLIAVGDGRRYLDWKANCKALGFEPLAEIFDPYVREVMLDEFMPLPDIPDVMQDNKDYRMFIGYRDEAEYQDICSWEQRASEGMYKFGAIVGGTLPTPGGPFIPNEYYGIRDGNLGFSKDAGGTSIPKLKNTFEPSCKQYPIASLETLEAPFNGVLIESGNWLPTGLYFGTLMNPWGTPTEEFQKAFSKTFTDNACTKFNSSLNVIEDQGLAKTPQGIPIEVMDYKTQSWEIGMFAPKFFDDTEKIVANFQELLADLYDEGRLVDEISLPKWDINFNFRRHCKKVSVMILTNCRTHPNIYFDVAPLSQPAKNEEARKQYMYWAMEEHKRKQREDVMDRCDRDILYEFCENATKAKGRAAAMGAMFGFGAGIDMANCQVSPTGIYREGFDRTLIGGWPIPAHLGGMQFTPGVGWRQQYAQGLRNSRQLRVTVVRNPTNVAGIKPTDAYGHYYLQDLEEDLRPLVRKTFNKNIVYPVNNFEMQSPIPPYSYSSWATNPRFQQYSGIWTANVTVQDRIDELIEIYGEPPNGFNSTAGVKIINNNVDPDLTAMMDPDTKMFISRMMDINGNEIKSVAGYHNLMAHGPLGSKGLDDFSVVKPTQSIDIKLAGSINDFPNFQTFIHPVMGLTSYSINLSDDGLTTDMSFATRPPEAPKEESILNKIGPRTM